MQMIVTAKQMSEMDRAAIEDVGIPGLILMENAGRGIVEVARSMLERVKGKTVKIFCGPGNNGGDGFVVARHLLNMGAQVDVLLVGKKENIRGDAHTNMLIYQNMEQSIKQVQATEHVPSDVGADLIVDALLGTGVQGSLRGIFADVVDKINRSGAPILAIDIPTGMDTDTGAVEGPCIHAAATATMALPKRGLLLSPGREHVGKLTVVDISMPEFLCSRFNSKTFLVMPQDVQKMLPIRPSDAYKNACGTAMVIAGSMGFTGAASLTAESVLRSGAGLTYLSAAKSLNVVFEQRLTEVITVPFEDNGLGCLTVDTGEAIINRAASETVVAIGPGLGTHTKTVKLVKMLVEKLDKPLVLDADGLNALSESPDLISKYKNDMILTPHPGELSRLIQKTNQEILDDRIEIARQTAQSWGQILVLKGSPTIVADKSGEVYINTTGNAGMATGGSGDVLTGIIAGLLAQGMSAIHAAIAGVFIHGLAGDLAKGKFGEMGMIAGDILKYVPEAFITTKNMDQYERK